MSDLGAFSKLVGEELSSVCFVRDYVEFHFDGPIVRALSLPKVTVGGKCFLPDTPGWRDALCALIGRKVVAASPDGGVFLLSLEGDASAEVSLTPTGNAVEALHFVPTGQGPMQIW